MTCGKPFLHRCPNVLARGRRIWRRHDLNLVIAAIFGATAAAVLRIAERRYSHMLA